MRSDFARSAPTPPVIKTSPSRRDDQNTVLSQLQNENRKSNRKKAMEAETERMCDDDDD